MVENLAFVVTVIRSKRSLTESEIGYRSQLMGAPTAEAAMFAMQQGLQDAEPDAIFSHPAAVPITIEELERVGVSLMPDAIAEIDRLRAEVQRLEGALRNSIPAVPDDGYLPGLNSLMCDAPLRSPEEQFTRRMLRAAIARCLFRGLPDEREWKWEHLGRFAGFYLYNKTFQFFISEEEKEVALYRYGDLEWATIPAPIWDKAWRETGMK